MRCSEILTGDIIGIEKIRKNPIQKTIVSLTGEKNHHGGIAVVVNRVVYVSSAMYDGVRTKRLLKEYPLSEYRITVYRFKDPKLLAEQIKWGDAIIKFTEGFEGAKYDYFDLLVYQLIRNLLLKAGAKVKCKRRKNTKRFTCMKYDAFYLDTFYNLLPDWQCASNQGVYNCADFEKRIINS